MLNSIFRGLFAGLVVIVGMSLMLASTLELDKDDESSTRIQMIGELGFPIFVSIVTLFLAVGILRKMRR